MESSAEVVRRNASAKDHHNRLLHREESVGTFGAVEVVDHLETVVIGIVAFLRRCHVGSGNEGRKP